MAFAAGVGLGDRRLGALEGDPRAILFNEELGAVLQVREADVAAVRAEFARAGLADCVHDIGEPRPGTRIAIARGDEAALRGGAARAARRCGRRRPTRMQRLRDDPECADEEQASRIDATDPGLLDAGPVRSGRGHRRAVHRAWRTAPRRDPARAGSQRSDRDGGRVRPRGIRGGRRAHERHPRRTGGSRWFRRARHVRRLLVRRRARRGRRLGQVDPVE